MANSGNGRTRLENAIAYSIAGLIGLSVISIVAIPVVTVFFPKTPPIPVLVTFPWLGLPTSALLIIVLLVMQIRSKGKNK
jgi:amino acid transporter